MPRLVLASASPRRAELLSAAGFDFEVVAADIDERRWPDEAPADHVVRLAIDKARAVQTNLTDQQINRPIVQSPDRPIILGADTAVVVGSRVLGKPRDREDAAEMLRALSGRTHEVLTGVAILVGDRLATGCATTAVTFEELSAAEIEWYVATDEPMDKAGAYAVQGRASRFVSRIEGPYANVVGLPIETVYRLLKQLSLGQT